MYMRCFSILYFIFLSVSAAAQHGNDSFPLFNKISSFELVDIKQQKNTSLPIENKELSLFLFLSPECPLCQNYTRTLNELNDQYNQQVNLYGIVPGNAYTNKEVNDFATKYHTRFPIFIDGNQQLTTYLKAAVTPQAILVDHSGNLVYSGAIDDWVQGLGKKKLTVSEHYVRDAIAQILAPGEVKIKRTKAFGCKINDY